MFRILILIIFISNLGFSQEYKHGYTFIENKQQWNSNIEYKADIKSGYLYLEKNGFVFDLVDVKTANKFISSHYKTDNKKPIDSLNWHSYRVTFLNSNKDIKLQGSDKVKEYYNFFIGKNKNKWASKVRGFNTVNYFDVYKNIDARIYTKLFDLKYDFIVKKGGNPNDIKLEYKGVDKLKIINDRLHIFTSVNHVVEDKPFAYQIINKKIVKVECYYSVNNNILTFDFPSGYNPDYDLIIDPTLKFSTYSGSFSNNFGYTATFDSKGFLYSGSTAFGNQYPTTLGAYSTSFSGGIADIAISKFDTTGTFLIYSTYIGGSSDEQPHSLIVNSLDELFILGTTSSLNYPTTTGCYDPVFNGGTSANLQNGLGVNYVNGSDIVISNLSSDGSNLLGSTYLGGSQNDGLNFTSTNPMLNTLKYNYADEIRGEIDIDKNNNIYIVSCTQSTDFPTTSNVFQTTYGGGNLDACITKMDNSLQNIIWSSFLGGENHDAGYSLALDSKDDLYVTGGTASNLFPVTTNSYQNTFQGGRSDGFITKINKNGQNIISSTFYGSTTYDQSYFVELDKDDNVYVFGQTEHTGNNFIHNANWNIAGSGQFISKLLPNLNNRIYSTVFGSGNGINISPSAFLVDVCNKIYLSGWGGNVNQLSSLFNNAGTTNNMPITSDAFQITTDGSDFYVMVMDDNANNLVYGSYFGSASASEHVDGGTSRFDRKGRIYQSICAGCGSDSNMPTYPTNAVSNTNNSSCNLGVFKMDFDIPSIVADFVAPPLGCSPYSYTFENTSLIQANTSYNWNFGDGNTSTNPNPTNIYTQPGTYTIRLIISDSTSCNISDTIERDIIVLGNMSSNLNDINICPSQTSQIGLLPNNNSQTTYNWSPNINLSNPNISNPFATPTSTTEYTLLVSNGTCTDTIRQTVNVNTPLLSVSNDTTICFSPNNIELIANSYGSSNSFIWSASNTFQDTLNNNVIDSIYNFTPNNTQTLYIKINNNGCEKIDSVYVNTIYGNNFLTGNNSICKYDTATITANSNFNTGISSITYDWFPDNQIITGDGTQTIQTNPNSTTNYSLIINVDGCVDTLNYNINVTNVDVSIPNDTTVCNANLGVNFNATSSLANTNFIWSTNNIISDTINSNINNGNIYVMPQNDTLFYILAQNNGCSILDSVSVDIVFGQTNIVGNNTSCQGDTIILVTTNTASTNNIMYNWNPNNNIIGGNGADSIIIIAQSNTTYFLYAENGGCYDTLQHNINVTPIELNAIEDTTICFDSNYVNLVANSNGTTNNFIWSSSSNFLDTLNQPITNNEISVQGYGIETYYVKVKNGNCILIDSTSVNSIFGNYNVVFPNNICYGDSAIIYIQNDYINNNITHNLTPNTSVIYNNVDSILITPTTSTNYNIISSLESCSTSFDFSINVVNVELNVSNDTVLCTDTSIINIWANSNGTTNNFIWSSSSNFLDTINNPISDSTITISPTAPSTYYVKINENGCVLEDSVIVVVTSGQIETLFKNEICLGEQTSISVVNLAPNFPLSYDWKPDEEIISGDNTPTIIVKPDTTTTYTVVGTNSFGCVVEDTITIKINELGFIDINANTSNDTIIEGESTNVFALPNNENYNYTWTEGVDNINSQTTSASPKKNTTYYVTIEKNGCTKTDSITIYVKELLCGEEDVYVPNAFTPNNDNSNDNLFVRGNNITKLLFRVYDRWGELMFETTNKNIGWDGTYKGKDCDPAVFVYYLEVTCGEGDTYFEKGNISLIR